MKNIFLTVLALAIFVSCKNDAKNESSEDVVAEEQINPNFNVEVFAYAAQKDDFALYYTEDNTTQFRPEVAEWSGIEAGKPGERVYFEIKEERLPTHIRLDFGLNKAQDSVVIEKIKLNYLKNSFEIKGSEFFNYFIVQEDFKTKIDSSKGTLSIYKDGAEYKSPFYYPQESLVLKIKELTTR